MNKLRIGIQGAEGSFNEEALREIARKRNIGRYETVYCLTTRRVLTALCDGLIDRGVFAIYNSRSELVDETAAVLGHYLFDVLDFVTLPIRHNLMSLPSRSLGEIHTVMGHPEALAQCLQTLARKYPRQKLLSGDEKLPDGAAAAVALVKGELDRGVAVLGSRAIARRYGLEIIARDLQDDPANTTTFLFVQLFK